MMVNNTKVVCQKSFERVVEDDLKRAVQHVDNNLKLKEFDKNKHEVEAD